MAKRAPYGRKFSDALTAKMVVDLEKGHYLETVAVAHGLGISTLYLWRKKGKAGEEPYAKWLEVITRAEAQGELNLGNTALDGDKVGVSNGKATAAMKWLERTRGKKFQPKIMVQVEHELGILIDVLAAVLPDEHYAACLDAIIDLVDVGIPGVLSEIAIAPETTH